MGHPLRLGLLVVLAALALAGCGRRGPLELPPGAPRAPADAATAAQQTRVLNDDDQPGLIQSPDKVYERSETTEQQIFKEAPAAKPINAPPAPAKHGGFFLDPLL